jgi:hypothetical protein
MRPPASASPPRKPRKPWSFLPAVTNLNMNRQIPAELTTHAVNYSQAARTLGRSRLDAAISCGRLRPLETQPIRPGCRRKSARKLFRAQDVIALHRRLFGADPEPAPGK